MMILLEISSFYKMKSNEIMRIMRNIYRIVGISILFDIYNSDIMEDLRRSKYMDEISEIFIIEIYWSGYWRRRNFSIDHDSIYYAK